MTQELENQIKLYNIFGVIFGKKDSTTSGQIPVFSSETNTLEDSGVTASEISELVNAAPEPAIANPTGGGTVDIQARAAIDSILTVLRSKNIIES